MKVKAVSGITLTLLLINMLTLIFNTQPVDANPVYPGQVTMTREDIDTTISLADSVVQASVNGTYTFDVIGPPLYPVTMYYPVPPNASNVSVKIDETPLAWDWDGTYYHTVLGDYPFIRWTIFTYPAYFTIKTHYEHPVPLIEREYQFLYAMGTGRYLAEPKECEAYVRTYVSKDVAPTQSLMEVYLVTGEGILEPATHEITSLDGVWNVSYHVTFWWGWSKDFLITIRANPWTVDDDGPADFQTIQEAINAASPGDTIYVYNGTYYEHVVVNKTVCLVGENRIATIINGTGTETVVRSNASDVEIRGFTIRGGLYPNSSVLVEDCMGNAIRDNIIESEAGKGVVLNHSSNSVVDGNIVRATFGIYVVGGSGNNISNNFVRGLSGCCIEGLVLTESSNNVVTGNRLGEHYALRMYKSNNNYVALNFIAGHMGDVATIVNSNNNSIVDNTIFYDFVSSWKLIAFRASNSNVLYHNSFLGNMAPLVSIDDVSMNITWDNGYPSGGNYWSDYNGTDLYRGPYQNITGSDGIGDTAYIIDTNNTDRYPLINPVPPFRDIAITNILPSKTIIGQGYSLNVSITIANIGTYTENFNVTAYYNATSIETKTVTNLPSSEETTLTFTLNTTTVPYGNYTISANATILPSETATTDNAKTDGWVMVTVPGDVDGDGECNILDMKLVKLVYSGLIDDPNADLDNNGVINILDVKIEKLIYSGIL